MTNREIDALIAEKVMGWVRTPGVAEEYSSWRDSRGARQCRVKDFSPSTDPAASKQSRDKMRADGWKWCLFGVDKFTMRLWGYKRDQNTVEATADTEEMAVALAALRAVGVEL